MQPHVKTPGTFTWRPIPTIVGGSLAGQIATALNGAEFENHGATSARIRDLTAQAKALIAEVEAAAP